MRVDPGMADNASCRRRIPGVTRGNHFHLRKFERFAVISGDAVIRLLRRLFDDTVHEFAVSGAEPVFIDMPTLHTHSIENTGNGELMTLFWSHRILRSGRCGHVPGAGAAMSRRLRVVTVVGTRPEIIRLSRVVLRLDESVEHVLVHTGQNHDYELSEIFFRDLGLRRPDHYLNAVGDNLGATIGDLVARTYELLERAGNLRRAARRG